MNTVGWIGLGVLAMAALLLVFGLALFTVNFRRELSNQPGQTVGPVEKPGFVDTLVAYMKDCLTIMISATATVNQKLMATGAFCVILSAVFVVGGLIPLLIGTLGSGGGGGGSSDPSTSPTPSTPATSG